MLFNVLAIHVRKLAKTKQLHDSIAISISFIPSMGLPLSQQAYVQLSTIYNAI